MKRLLLILLLSVVIIACDDMRKPVMNVISDPRGDRRNSTRR